MSCLLSVDWADWLQKLKPGRELVQWGTVASSSFGLIAAAEIGDKSQLVCMTLAARYHRTLPILSGAVIAFALLNLAAVLFGAAVAHWVPEMVVGAVVVILFTVFGLRALLTGEEEEGDSGRVRSNHGMFLTTFLMIFAAEFGDKTQLAVAALSAALPPGPVWLGATLALAMTSALGVWVGRALLRYLPVHWLHRVSGVLFLGFAAYTIGRVVPAEAWIASWRRLVQVFGGT